MKVRIGIIGCARILNAHLRGYKILQENGFGDLFQITALCARKEEDAHRFRDSYETQAGSPLAVPVFFGLQILEQGGVLFSSVPDSVRAELDAGRSGVDIAVELYGRFREAGLNDVYLMPPIRRGGGRDYGAAREFLGDRGVVDLTMTVAYYSALALAQIALRPEMGGGRESTL